MINSFKYISSGFWSDYGEKGLNNSMFLAGGPWNMLAATATYLLAVTWLGPQLMRNRKPIEGLMWPIRAYNLTMVIFNAYLFWSLSRKLNFGFDCWGCAKESAMKRLDPEGLKLWDLALLSRYLDFFDSMFFICRKKFSHLSVLHVSHHALVPSIFWFAGKFQPTPSVAFAGYINLSVHVIMYSYYFLSTFSSLRPFLWWKRYLTKIQIAQFCIDLIHGLQIVYWPHCRYNFMIYIEVVFSISYIILFGNFYVRSYLRQRQQAENNNNNNQIHCVKEQQTISQQVVVNGQQQQQDATTMRARDHLCNARLALLKDASVNCVIGSNKIKVN